MVIRISSRLSGGAYPTLSEAYPEPNFTRILDKLKSVVLSYFFDIRRSKSLCCRIFLISVAQNRCIVGIFCRWSSKLVVLSVILTACHPKSLHRRPFSPSGSQNRRTVGIFRHQSIKIIVLSAFFCHGSPQNIVLHVDIFQHRPIKIVVRSASSHIIQSKSLHCRQFSA